MTLLRRPRRLAHLALALVAIVSACEEKKPNSSTDAPRAATAPGPTARAPSPAAPATKVAAVERPIVAKAPEAELPRLEGSVVDGTDEPIAGAAIRCGAAEQRTDAQGRFVLGVAFGGICEVRAPGYRTRRARAPGPATLRRVTHPMIAVGTVGGSVLDRDGAPVVGARVELAGSGVWPSRATLTDGHGRYAFADIPEGAYELRAARAADGPLAPIATPIVDGVFVEGPGGTATVDLRAESAPGELVGRVADRGGRPLEGVRLVLSDGALPLLSHAAESDAHGAYAFGPIAPGDYVLRAEAPELPPSEPSEVFVGVGTTTFHVSLRQGATVAGVVLGAEGEPVAGARLAVRHEAEGSLSSAARRESRAQVFGQRRGAPPSRARASDAAITDAQGRFRLKGLPAGPLRVLAFHRGRGLGASGPIDAREGDAHDAVEVRLRPACGLDFRVVDDLGNPADGARVVLTDPEGLWPRRVLRAGEGGRSEVRGLPCGPLLASTVETGHVGEAARVMLTREQPAELTLHLLRGELTIEGLCLDLEGAPVVGALVTLAGETRTDLEPRRARTDEVGSFRFTSLPRGRYGVRVDAEGYTSHASTGVDGQEALEVRLAQSGGLSGRVVDEREGPIEGAQVVARNLDDGREASARSDRDGAFRVGVSFGRYDVRIEAKGFEGASERDVYVDAEARPGLFIRMRAATPSP